MPYQPRLVRAASLSQPSRARTLKTSQFASTTSQLTIVRLVVADGPWATADVVIDTSTTPFTAHVDGSSLFAAQTAVGAFNAIPDELLTVEVLFNPDLTTAWVMVPALVGLILTFIGTIITSIGLVKERQTGTLEQLAVMPLKPSDVIVGKIAPYFILASVDMLIVACTRTTCPTLCGIPNAPRKNQIVAKRRNQSPSCQRTTVRA